MNIKFPVYVKKMTDFRDDTDENREIYTIYRTKVLDTLKTENSVHFNLTWTRSFSTNNTTILLPSLLDLPDEVETKTTTLRLVYPGYRIICR